MARVLAGETSGPDGLRFGARKANISPANLTLKVQMDQQGSGAELRNRDGQVVFRLDGRQLDELHAKNQLDVSRPEKLKNSIIQVFEHQRAEPQDPQHFVLDLRDIDPSQLVGRLKLLVDWLGEHVENDVFVDPHKTPNYPEIPPPSAPTSEEPPASEPPASEPPASEPPASEPPASEQPASESEPASPPAKEAPDEPIPESGSPA